MKQLSDEQLVAIIQSSADHTAFDVLFRRYHSKLKGFLKSRMQESVADDVIQETYIKAFTKISQFQLDAAFSTWLFSIAVNEYKQFTRKAGIFEKLKESLFRQPKAYKETADIDVLIDFNKSAKALSRVQYDVYVMSRVYGYSHREITGLTELPLGTVKTHILKAEKRIKVSDSE
ncbi:hypothetical protein CEW91_05245 [Idiomarina piscisalsi]|uniref:RNA polymerase sigma factor n=1 Tax=Idiomarina piscisalsi TaxID=1096243 RepID=A0ABM6LSZ7_9GAMM|nr:sigma-70 family RNA polymerase sigma factor [Idiomarina piscisalsi]ASG65575.1 hypothetical protein CEW91_05245 [Idiomarina piscisalsi]